MKHDKLNRMQKNIEKEARIKNSQKGEGLFLYANTGKSDLQLPKSFVKNGVRRTWLEAKEEFEGDSYFKSFVGKGLRMIKVINDPESERKIMEEKLLLDQPDKVTTEGTVETVLKNPKQHLNENVPQKEIAPTLLNEDPLSGVEIILK